MAFEDSTTTACAQNRLEEFALSNEILTLSSDGPDTSDRIYGHSMLFKLHDKDFSTLDLYQNP